jgi:hypothetical protein
MPLNPTTKLAAVRDAMAAGDWESAIRLTARLRSLGKFQKEIDRANEFLNNPKFFEQLGYEHAKVMDAAIAALKEKYSKSWEKIQEENEERAARTRTKPKPIGKRTRAARR